MRAGDEGGGGLSVWESTFLALRSPAMEAVAMAIVRVRFGLRFVK